MAGNVGNGKTGTLRERMAQNQTEREKAIAKLEGADWTEEEPSTQTHVHAAPGSTIVVDQTGKHRALQVTLPDNEKPSDPAPQSGMAKVATGFLGAVRGWPQALVALGILALVAFWIWTRR
jgi:hypothetical protein